MNGFAVAAGEGQACWFVSTLTMNKARREHPGPAQPVADGRRCLAVARELGYRTASNLIDSYSQRVPSLTNVCRYARLGVLGARICDRRM